MVIRGWGDGPVEWYKWKLKLNCVRGDDRD